MTSAAILEPTGQSDTTLKFTAGLIMSVPFEAEIRNLVNLNRLRLKVKYPDQKTQIILPRPAHMKPLNPETNSEGKLNQLFVFYVQINFSLFYTF